MRLKHMVKDKINYRASKDQERCLQDKPVQGRANDGGLRIGEMERDVVISQWNLAEFLRESMMELEQINIKWRFVILTGLILLFITLV